MTSAAKQKSGEFILASWRHHGGPPRPPQPPQHLRSKRCSPSCWEEVHVSGALPVAYKMISRRSCVIFLSSLLLFACSRCAECAGLRPPKAFIQRKPATGDTTPSSDYPTWKDIFEKPIRISSLEEWQFQPQSKCMAIIIRPFALHLTVLSSLSPLIFAGALRTSSSQLNPRKALAWTACMTSWHAAHNMINDYQDMKDDDSRQDSYRLAYGVHALQQGFVSKSYFFGLMAAVALPGILLSLSFREDANLGPAFPWGFAALVLYTPLFKPFALGEVLVYLVWGPLMAGFGELAALGETSGVGNTLVAQVLTSPVAAIMGAIATQMIFGKHTDKITRSKARTLPSLLGYGSGALTACKIMLFAPYILLARALSIGRIGGGEDTPIMPVGAALAFVAFFREGLGTLRVIEEGQPIDSPTITEKLKGTIEDADLVSNWPLWFVAALGWHAITFGYLAFIGSGLEWLIKIGIDWLFFVLQLTT